MNRTQRIVATFVVLGLLGGLGYGTYALVRSIVHTLLSITPEVSAAIVAGTVTTLVSVFTVVWNQRAARARGIAEGHRASKVDVYKRFMAEGVVGLLNAKREGRLEDEAFTERLTTFFLEFTGDAIVWGSPEFLRAYTRFRAVEDGAERLLALDDLLRAIRTDLGNSNRGLERGDLIGLFLTDPESLHAIGRESQS